MFQKCLKGFLGEKRDKVDKCMGDSENKSTELHKVFSKF